MHEDVIDNFGKNFLGLTIGCARCHDHKYDPITAEDYCALYGIFNSSRFAFPGCEPKGQPRDLVPIISQADVDALMKPWQARVAIAEAEKKRRMESIGAATKTISVVAKEATRTLSSAQLIEGRSVSFADGERESLGQIQVRKGEVIQLTVLPNASHGADTTLVEWTITETAGEQRKWSLADLVQSLTQGNPHADKDGASWCFLDVTDAPKFLTEKSDSINGNGALKKWSIGSEPSVFVNASDQQVMVWTTLAAAIAATLMKLPDDDLRTAQAYRVLFQREPSIAERDRASLPSPSETARGHSIAERDRARAFLNNYPATPGEKWSAYARVLLASNEFIHLDYDEITIPKSATICAVRRRRLVVEFFSDFSGICPEWGIF